MANLAEISGIDMNDCLFSTSLHFHFFSEAIIIVRANGWECIMSFGKCGPSPCHFTHSS